MIDPIETREPILSFVRECLLAAAARGLAPEVAEQGRRMERASQALAACRTLCTLYRPPAYRTLDPAVILSKGLPGSGAPAFSFNFEKVTECVGDVDQVLECLRLMLDNVSLDADSALAVELFEEDNVPRVVLSLDGPGRFADPLSLGGYARLSLDELNARWTLATRGGRMDKTVNGWDMRLRGVRIALDGLPALVSLLERIVTAERHVKAARQWIGLAEAGETSPRGAANDEFAAALRAVDTALSEGDGPAPDTDTCDLVTMIEEAAAYYRDALTREGLRLELLCDAHIPPMRVQRRVMRRFFATLLQMTPFVLPEGGALSVLMDYDRVKRAVACAVSFSASAGPAVESFHGASLRRAVVECLGGSIESVPEPQGIGITAVIPDVVGRSLAEWIPGYDHFSERSRQMLRLLKSGSPSELETIILPGVLEEELERWLLPRLSTAKAAHVAHELSADNKGLPGTSRERLTKALAQIRRGKPRKEICKPAYAAEILWAFRGDERRRATLGEERLDENSLRALCAALLASPPDSLSALRYIARFAPLEAAVIT